MEENKRVKDKGFVASELERAKADLLSGMEKQFNNKDKIESSRWVQQYLNNYLEQEHKGTCFKITLPLELS